ncbi:hypothetical protein Bbelb_042550 [Branchiostoma belcheri]|nr:hypothetical protein Bbelb_042550 [Branchiostoma belcheri]
MTILGGPALECSSRSAPQFGTGLFVALERCSQFFNSLWLKTSACAGRRPELDRMPEFRVKPKMRTRAQFEQVSEVPENRRAQPKADRELFRFGRAPPRQEAPVSAKRLQKPAA